MKICSLIVADIRMTCSSAQPDLTRPNREAYLDSLVSFQQIPQQTYQQIRIDASLVRLINYHMAHTLQVGIPTAHPPQQDTGGEKHKTSVLASTLLATDGISDRTGIVDIFHALLRYTLRDAHGCHSARLGDDDVGRCAPQGLNLMVEDELR